MFVTKSTGAPFANQPRDASFNSNVLLLHGDGTDGSNNSVFLDSSGYNTITKIGNPAQGTFSPYAPTGWSVLFNGTTDYLTLQPISDLNSPAYGGLTFGAGSASNTNGDFTVEAWIYQTSDSGLEKNIFSHWAVPQPEAYHFYLRANNRLSFQLYTQNSPDVADLAISLNTWTHVAFCRSGTTVRTFINGVLKDTTTGVTNSANGNASEPTIGASPAGAGEFFAGYISNLRITKRIALYTANFTPSTVPLPQYRYPSIGGAVWKQDPGTGGVSLLACSSNRFKDVHNTYLVTGSYPGTSTMLVYGAPKITNFVPFAPTSAYSKPNHGGSVYFNGSTDYLTTSASNSFYFSTEFFAIEFWIYPTSNTGNQVIFDTYANTYSLVGNTGGPGGMLMYLTSQSASDGGAQIFFYYSNTTSNTIQSVAPVINSGEPPSGRPIKYNSWNYVKLAYQADSQVSNLNQIAGFPTGNSAVGLTIGYRRSTNGNTSLTYYSGYMSDFKITKYNAAYNTTSYEDYNTNSSNTSSIGYFPLYPFTANSNYIAAYPPNTQFLMSLTNAGIIDSSQKNNILTVRTAAISTTQSKFGGESIFFNGTTDYATIPNSDLFNLTTGDFTIEAWIYPTVLGGENGIYCKREVSTFIGVVFRVLNTTSKLVMQIADAAGTAWAIDASDSGLPALTINAWYHVALVRSGSSFRIFQGGVAGTASTFAGNITHNTAPTYIGKSDGSAGNQFFNGYIDDLRITKGVARYTASFTPPTRQHPDR